MKKIIFLLLLAVAFNATADHGYHEYHEHRHGGWVPFGIGVVTGAFIDRIVTPQPYYQQQYVPPPPPPVYYQQVPTPMAWCPYYGQWMALNMYCPPY